MQLKLLLVGCGKMGGAILQRAAHEATVCVVEPNPPPPELKTLSGIAWATTAEEIDPQFKPDVIVIAVKPQLVATVLPSYARYSDSVFVSIAAGSSIGKIQTSLGGNKNFAVVRSMPNLPASIGEGITVAVANKNVTPQQHDMADKILKPLGTMMWIDDESLIDAVTAISGSGPAYVFALTEHMAKAGEALGLKPDFAAKLARQTVIGSGALLAQSKETAEALRINVTSPGGTTEAGLKTLMALTTGLPTLIAKTVKAAFNRAKELSQ